MPPKKSNVHLNTARVEGGELYKRRCQSKAAVKKQKQRQQQRWIDVRDTLTSLIPTIKGSKGKVRTFEENKMIVLAIQASLKRLLKAYEKDNNLHIGWTMIEDEVSRDFHFSRKYVSEIRKNVSRYW